MTRIGGFNDFPSMEERGEVYGKDLTDGFYRSRFGFRIMVIDGDVFKIKNDGDLLPIYPSAYSIFIKERNAS
jgi:hypothetical protein